jgi:hypothetical protein
LTGVEKLAARKRPGARTLINAETLVAFGAKSDPTPVKGDIARATGSPKRRGWSGDRYGKEEVIMKT